MNISKSGSTSPSVTHELQELVEVKFINRLFLDKEDPEQLRGSWLRGFSFSFNRFLSLSEHSKLDKIRKDLYVEIDRKLREYQDLDPHLGQENLHFKLINYIDYKYQRKDRERLYIELIRNTIRQTKVTTLIRIFVNGSNLFIAADSYTLGKLKKRQLILQIFIFWVLISPGSWFIYTITGGLALILAIGYLYKTWISFIRSLFQRESLMGALRINFPKNVRSKAISGKQITRCLRLRSASLHPERSRRVKSLPEIAQCI